ncbi:hypothetical protein SARC_02463 [Sphaeroforma arctica JP610]|uniref:Uncharacterized protein n=1 Tax=Sphaeroforma arctica JP610 TaxID=667725 RepID=A0A0L0G8H7_9EUKA|nr:hypothetical protein SARC_02463 [Sphaeroforma arctica JP610]KNC85342.1 hypothetical protein SARC_02463 [Sphaeroforma arctica JP610]|eukprot:XP_014159244.1 hypothetical protein SARC_02463 [Sphaeroforma arctica JP610]
MVKLHLRVPRLASLKCETNERLFKDQKVLVLDGDTEPVNLGHCRVTSTIPKPVYMCGNTVVVRPTTPRDTIISAHYISINKVLKTTASQPSTGGPVEQLPDQEITSDETASNYSTFGPEQVVSYVAHDTCRLILPEDGAGSLRCDHTSILEQRVAFKDETGNTTKYVIRDIFKSDSLVGDAYIRPGPPPPENKALPLA